jgi:hypothetical protein
MTREYIKAESQHRETVDETLRRLLEINPTEAETDSFERLTAFLSEENTDQLRQAKEVIEDEIDVKLDYQQNGGSGGTSILLFQAEAANMAPVVEIETTERDSYRIVYASGSENWSTFCRIGSDITAQKNWREELRRVVRGAVITSQNHG